MASKQPIETPLKIEEIINFQQYPIADRTQPKYLNLIAHCRRQLQERGCCVLKNFLTNDALFFARQESLSLQNEAYYATRKTNILKTDDDPTLPVGHPARFFMERSNAFVPKNKFQPQSLFLTIYHEVVFQNFIAACLGTEVIHEYDDPLAGLVLNILQEGAQHPWHYDDNDFSIVLMVQPSREGGIFEYAPHIRTPSDENFESVSKVLHGHYEDVQKNSLQPGDLQIFQGKLSLHRVTKVVGKLQRYTVIFSYNKQRTSMGKEKENELLFGRAALEFVEQKQL